MDIYQYLNSNDIAEYLRNIEYKFSIIEAAYLIYQCRTITLENKLQAWQDIIDSYPDCAYERRKIKTESFRQCLDDYISLQRRILEEFNKEEQGTVYWYCWHELDSNEWYCSPDDDAIFSNYDACYQSFKKKLQENYYSSDKLAQLTFRKTWLNPKGHYGDNIDVEVNQCHEITKISKSNLLEEEDSLDLLFEDMWIDIPTPFQRGDILVRNEGSEYDKRNIPFVLNALATWDLLVLQNNGFGTNDYLVKYAEERLQRFVKKGTSMDMWAKGYRTNEKGYLDVVEHNSYLDLEYYRGILRGKEQFLSSVGRFLKGETPFDVLLGEHYRQKQEGESPLFGRQLQHLFEETKNTKKIFIGGSKTMEALPPGIHYELYFIMKNNYQVLIGDCRGVDMLVQRSLNRSGYGNVVVYASGDKVRNNVGGWPVCHISVESGLTPFEFYRQKDIAMAEASDCGIMVWDGKSKGTHHNIKDMYERGKEVKIFLSSY